MILGNNMPGLFLLIIGYALGSFPSGYIAGKVFSGVDLRELGSGSTGATNVLRQIGKGPALVVFVVDVLKGVASVLIAKELNFQEGWQVAAGLASLTGHIWPIWLDWKGGKAVATGLGMFLGLSWTVGLASLGIFLTILSFSKIVSLASVSAAVSLPLLMFLSFGKENFSQSYFFVSLIAMILVIWRHRSNLKRLWNGDEPKISQSR